MINSYKLKLRQLETNGDSIEQQSVRSSLNELESLLEYRISKLSKQKDIINKLLEREDLDINCIDLKYGITPLHIACLRGDSPELVQKLLNKGADLNAVNYKSKKPIDLLDYSYEDTQKIIGDITGGWAFGTKDLYTEYDENQSAVTTLPTREERESNIKVIREILCTTKSRSDASTVDNQIPKYDNTKKAITIATLVAITVMVPLSIYFIVQESFLAAGMAAGCIIVAATVLYCSYNAKVDNKSPSRLLNDLKLGHESLKKGNSIPLKI